MDTHTIAVVGLLVGALAAIAALVNATTAIADTWHDSRALTIEVTVHRTWDNGADWIIRIWNRARTPNALAGIELFIDKTKFPGGLVVFGGPDDGLIGHTLLPFSYTSATLSATTRHEIPHEVWSRYEDIELRVHSVRGRRRRFRFRREVMNRVLR